jgi:hypothetical protein
MLNTNNINAEVVTVTPEYAKALLERNIGNRKVAPANLSKVSESLRSGEWKLNGEAIKIAKDGRILDGQHRLTACVETGISFTTLVITGLEPETQETMDSGKSRTVADALSIRGYKSAVNLASIATGIVRRDRYGLRPAISAGASSYPVTTPQVVARIESEPSIIDVVPIAQQANKAGMTSKTAGILYYVFSEIDPDDAVDFFHKLSKGDGLEAGNPILTLREALLVMKSERGSANQTYIAAIAIKAWNKYRDGEPMKLARFRTGGANPETFPEPK